MTRDQANAGFRALQGLRRVEPVVAHNNNDIAIDRGIANNYGGGHEPNIINNPVVAVRQDIVQNVNANAGGAFRRDGGDVAPNFSNANVGGAAGRGGSQIIITNDEVVNNVAVSALRRGRAENNNNVAVDVRQSVASNFVHVDAAGAFRRDGGGRGAPHVNNIAFDAVRQGDASNVVIANGAGAIGHGSALRGNNIAVEAVSQSVAPNIEIGNSAGAIGRSGPPNVNVAVGHGILRRINNAPERVGNDFARHGVKRVLNHYKIIIHNASHDDESDNSNDSSINSVNNDVISINKESAVVNTESKKNITMSTLDDDDQVETKNLVDKSTGHSEIDIDHDDSESEVQIEKPRSPDFKNIKNKNIQQGFQC
ncbi:hypothetical protein HCN44_011491 [Aphidius gifuensis]|uniref:Uncharacterized protein n=1 Tax=Aphidius gifuensis TaxID=684658 RepID=A0A834Y1H9_APHGI|nr:hypothetical protein HCN44_011491 [Aphidius gifuensis]